MLQFLHLLDLWVCKWSALLSVWVSICASSNHFGIENYYVCFYHFLIAWLGSVCKSLNDNLCLVFTDCTEKDTSKEEEQKSLKILLPRAKPEYRKQYWTQNCGITCHYSFSNSHVVCTSASSSLPKYQMLNSACETDVCKRVGLVIIWDVLSLKLHLEHCTALQLMCHESSKTNHHVIIRWIQ